MVGANPGIRHLHTEEASPMKRAIGFHQFVPLVIGAAVASCGGDAPTGHVGFLDQATSVHNNCPWGTCMVEHPVIINVYWQSSLAAWDDDIADAGLSTTVDRVDAYVAALAHS